MLVGVVSNDTDKMYVAVRLRYIITVIESVLITFLKILSFCSASMIQPEDKGEKVSYM